MSKGPRRGRRLLVLRARPPTLQAGHRGQALCGWAHFYVRCKVSKGQGRRCKIGARHILPLACSHCPWPLLPAVVHFGRHTVCHRTPVQGQAGASCLGPRRRAKCALQKIMPNKHSQNKRRVLSKNTGGEKTLALCPVTNRRTLKCGDIRTLDRVCSL